MFNFSVFLALSFLSTFPSFGQETGFFKTYTAPKFRNIHGVQALPNGSLIFVGGWPQNDAISSVFYSNDTGSNIYAATDKLGAMLKDCHFPTQNVGFVVGNQGMIQKSTTSGQTWTTLSLSGSAASRSYNAVFFQNENIGFAVGGNERNDAIQTIIKTTDGGQNWSVQSDKLAPWLRDVFFIDDNNGWAVGDKGSLLKTTNAGSNWTLVNLQGNLAGRQLNSVFFIDKNNGFIAGGNASRDSIQTLLKTTDGGSSWTVIFDKLNPMLNKVFFRNADNGYAVGDWGAFYSTKDGGNNWNELKWSGNDNRHIYDIHFLNENLGIVGGSGGKVLVYNDTTKLPKDSVYQKSEIQLNTPIKISGLDEVTIRGTVHAFGTATQVVLEYGEDHNFGNVLKHQVGTFAKNNEETFEFKVSGLDSGKIYYGRLKSSSLGGVSYSESVTFYTGYRGIPNFDFEHWITTNVDEVASWLNEGSITKVNSYNGTNAVKIQGARAGELGSLIYGIPNEEGLGGGIPFTSRPDSIRGWFQYDIHTEDSAIIYLKLTGSNGKTIALHQFYFTGSTQNKFMYHSFPISYLDASTPDSLALAITSSNPFAQKAYSSSWMMVDDISFTGTPETIPNGDMELWNVKERTTLANWASGDMDQPNAPYFVTRSNDAHRGDYALKLSNVSKNGNNKQFAYISTGNKPYERGKPNFKVAGRHDIFHVHLKYFPDNMDTLFVMLELFENGQPVGYASFFEHETIEKYLHVNTTIRYYNEWSQPDSGAIYINIRKGRWNDFSPGDSYTIIDNISLDGIVVKVNEFELTENPSIYPNPANNNINIKFNQPVKTNGQLLLINSNGQVVKNMIIPQKTLLHTINISSLTSGNYIMMYEQSGIIYQNNFIKI